MSRISVLMPVCNVESYVEEAINSVLKQTHRDFELLICNDGSSDMTGDICEKIASSDPRICVYHTKNQGVARSLNYLIMKANSEFCARMDGDDICAPHRLQCQLSYFDNHKALGVVGSKVRLFGMVDGLWRYRQTHDETKALMLIGNTALCHPSWLVRTTLYEQFKYDEEFCGMEDYEWLSRVLFESNHEGYCTNEILLNHRIHSASVSQVTGDLQVDLRMKVLRCLWEKWGIAFNDTILDFFCSALLHGDSYRLSDNYILEQAYEISSQLGKINSYTCDEINRRLAVISHPKKGLDEKTNID